RVSYHFPRRAAIVNMTATGKGVCGLTRSMVAPARSRCWSSGFRRWGLLCVPESKIASKTGERLLRRSLSRAADGTAERACYGRQGQPSFPLHPRVESLYGRNQDDERRPQETRRGVLGDRDSGRGARGVSAECRSRHLADG